MTLIHFYRFGYALSDVLTRLPSVILNALPERFAEIRVETGELNLPTNAYDAVRRQYAADHFLSLLGQHIQSGDHGFALVNLDLFVPQLNFVFGVAQYGGNAIVALPRLNPTFYGEPENPEIFFQRAAKETLHELGHVFGLEHCRNSCVMRFSNSLADTDRKPNRLCRNCFERLQVLGW